MSAERLLVLGDESESLDDLKKVLVACGYTVVVSDDTQAALRRMRDDPPDVVLIESQASGEVALHTLEALRRENQDVAIILAAPGADKLALEAARLGAHACLPKPYSDEALRAVLDRALTAARLRAERDHLAEQLARANQTLQWQLQELNALFVIGRSVTSAQDLEQVLARIVEAATFVTRAEEGSLMLLDGDTGELYLRAAKNLDETTAQGMRVSVSDSLAGRVVSTGRPVLLSGEGLKKVATTYLVKSLLMVPLKVPERGVIGVLLVANKQSPRAFSESDLHLLSAMADYAAVAIDNATLMANLQAEKTKLESILRETDDAVLVVDENGAILLCNHAARHALDLPGGNLVGQSAFDLIRQPELLDLLTHPTRNDAPPQTEVPLSDGGIMNAHVTAIRGVGDVVVMQDITHLKELDRIKSEFVATVSHDLRTPLTTIQGYIDLLPRVGPLTDQQHEFIARVQRSLSAVTQLVSDLLDIGRVEAGFDLEMVSTDLEPLVREVVAEMRPEIEAKAQHLRISMPRSLTPIKANPRRLRQVISNLISNAVKYTPADGHITVEVSEGENHVSIRVTDDGIGIPLADQPYIFDKFFRADMPETQDVPGTGLGLSIVKSVVEKHRGRVWVESAPGEGSTFTVLLPK